MGTGTGELSDAQTQYQANYSRASIAHPLFWEFAGDKVDFL